MSTLSRYPASFSSRKASRSILGDRTNALDDEESLYIASTRKNMKSSRFSSSQTVGKDGRKPSAKQRRRPLVQSAEGRVGPADALPPRFPCGPPVDRQGESGMASPAKKQNNNNNNFPRTDFRNSNSKKVTSTPDAASKRVFEKLEKVEKALESDGVADGLAQKLAESEMDGNDNDNNNSNPASSDADVMLLAPPSAEMREYAYSLMASPEPSSLGLLEHIGIGSQGTPTPIKALMDDDNVLTASPQCSGGQTSPLGKGVDKILSSCLHNDKNVSVTNAVVAEIFVAVAEIGASVVSCFVLLALAFALKALVS